MSSEHGPADSVFGPRTRGLTIAVMACVGIIAYNNLAVAAALPEVGSDLGDVALLPWTISAELLTSGVAILAAGPLVDGLGPRRVFRWSAAAFVTTSLLCGAATSMVALVGARALQGVAAGLLFTVTMAVMGLSYEADTRARVFAINSVVWGVMSVAGPSIAALMVSAIGWRGVFFFNVPVAVLAAVLAWQRLPDRPEPSIPFRRGVCSDGGDGGGFRARGGGYEIVIHGTSRALALGALMVRRAPPSPATTTRRRRGTVSRAMGF